MKAPAVLTPTEHVCASCGAVVRSTREALLDEGWLVVMGRDLDGDHLLAFDGLVCSSCRPPLHVRRMPPAAARILAVADAPAHPQSAAVAELVRAVPAVLREVNPIGRPALAALSAAYAKLGSPA